MNVPHYSQPLFLGNGGRCLQFRNHRWVSGRSTLSLAGTLDGDLLISCGGLKKRKSLRIPLVTEGPTWLASYQPCSTGTAEAAAGARTPAITCAGQVCITAAHSCLLPLPRWVRLSQSKEMSALNLVVETVESKARVNSAGSSPVCSERCLSLLCSLLWHHTKRVCRAVFSLQYLPRTSSESAVTRSGLVCFAAVDDDTAEFKRKCLCS